MRTSYSAAYLLGVAAAVAVLAGCSNGGSQSTLPTGVSTTQSSSQTTHVGEQARPASKGSTAGLDELENFLTKSLPGSEGGQAKIAMLKREVGKHHNRSWMKLKHGASAACTLLYVADPFEEAVYIYTWTACDGFGRGQMVGQLGGPSGFYFVFPTGLCVDKSNNVYVVDAGGPSFGLPGVWEFANNQILPINSWLDKGNVPISCSVDGKGNLAVSNFTTTTIGSGSVYVYSAGSATPQGYYNLGANNGGPPLLWVTYTGWDSSDNLYADGIWCCQIGLGGPTAFDNSQTVLLAGSSKTTTFNTLTPTGTFLSEIQWPGQIQWAYKHLNVNDINATPANSLSTCITQTTLGCGAQYETKVGLSASCPFPGAPPTAPCNLYQAPGVTYMNQSPIALGTWVASNSSAPNRFTVVPNNLNGLIDPGVACMFSSSPTDSCTLIYYYGLGGTPVQEIDQPNYQLFPMAATISQP